MPKYSPNCQRAKRPLFALLPVTANHFPSVQNSKNPLLVRGRRRIAAAIVSNRARSQSKSEQNRRLGGGGIKACVEAGFCVTSSYLSVATEVAKSQKGRCHPPPCTYLPTSCELRGSDFGEERRERRRHSTLLLLDKYGDK